MSISKEELKSIVAKICITDVNTIQDDTLLVGELRMDSIKIVELLATLSEDYAIHATEQDAANFDRFNDLYDFTQKGLHSN